jgi:glutathione synthase/RimK-type ligase-like ATP-grasp enzyme
LPLAAVACGASHTCSPLQVAILTPDPADEGYLTRWREVLANEAAPLAAAGVAIEGRTWTDPGDLARFDLVMPLLAWGYHREGARWRAATETWEAAGLPLANPPSVLRWNADKAYLRPLAERGAPVVPTRYVGRLDEKALAEASAAFGTDRLIAKPQVSASAWQTIRWSPGTALDGGPTGPALIQPYLPAIEREGEISLIYFAGGFSHAIRKRPQPGDFRVQPEYAGIITPHDPAADERAAADAILAAVEETLLYARVDLVRGLDGAPVLMELELVEPDLYLEHDPGRGAAFAAAVAGAAPWLLSGAAHAE